MLHLSHDALVFLSGCARIPTGDTARGGTAHADIEARAALAPSNRMHGQSAFDARHDHVEKCSSDGNALWRLHLDPVARMHGPAVAHIRLNLHVVAQRRPQGVLDEAHAAASNRQAHPDNSRACRIREPLKKMSCPRTGKTNLAHASISPSTASNSTGDTSTRPGIRPCFSAHWFHSRLRYS